MRIRRDVWKLDDDTLDWYGRAVAILRQRPLTDPTGWRYLAAMHGIDTALWRAHGIIRAGEAFPDQVAIARDWDQCQHQSWFFLPWHRCYIASVEAILLKAIIELGGPDTWAMPYWNYSDPANPYAGTLPIAFTQRTLPDGSENPLWLDQRYGTDGHGDIRIKPDDVSLGALREPAFAEEVPGASTGFGGPRTSFRHGGPRSANGQLERQPHNGVHGLVGGRLSDGDPEDARSYGFMSMPISAALDPVFWLHHANIDRLWEIWRRRVGQGADPTETAWLDGPLDRRFSMPAADGAAVEFSARTVLDGTALPSPYEYEDMADPLAQTMGVAMAAGSERREIGEMPPITKTELVGTNDGAVRVTGAAVESTVVFDGPALERMQAGLRPSVGVVGGPRDRVFLHLEDIKGINDAAVIYVYVRPSGQPETLGVLAGVISFFGVREAMTAAPGIADEGNGLNEVLDISDAVTLLGLQEQVDLSSLDVRLVPRTDVRPEDRISIGRISIYRGEG